ncbi:MAG: ABC transporter substrate-binding subunit SaoX [Pyramidobacter sp.]|jgi:NitT/TauT family transport system substrate-binding protein
MKMGRKIFCLALAALCGGVCVNSVVLAAEIDPDVAAMAAEHPLEPLSKEDAEYTVNLGYYNCDHMTAACIGQDSGIFKALGVKVEITGNGKVPEAMSAGRMDMAYAGWTTTLGAVENGTPLFIAAENHTGGAEYLVCSFNIKKPSDLIGKKIAAGGDPANAINWMEWTDQLGIPNDIEQYENFNMSDADEYFSMVAGKLDAFICCDPWGSMAEYEKTGWVMVRQNTDRPSGHGTCCKVCMNYDFAKKHPKLASRMLLAHTLCIQYMYQHPYKAARIFAENYNVPFEVGLMTLYKKLNEEGRTISWKLNQQNMQNQLDTMKRYHVRDDINTVNLDDYIDLSYFNASGAMDFDTFIKERVDPVFPTGMSYKEWRAKAVEVDKIVE